MNICIVRPNLGTYLEPFIRAQVEGLPGNLLLIEGETPQVGGRPIQSQAVPLRAGRKMWRALRARDCTWELTSAYMTAFRQHQTDVVLAQYGPTGVRVLDACRRLRIPLVVHFHGYDASVRSVLNEHADSYRSMFEYAAATIAVSQPMREKLSALGAPVEKLHLNTYGVNCSEFRGAAPATVGPVFIAVGRFVEKKAPELTLQAFAEVQRLYHLARLRMIGDGPLLKTCRDRAEQLGIAHAVTFLGEQTSPVIADEMRQARCFVQHSVEAPNGDCEGTPVAVIEAGASGLPVVATRHGGIPEVVVDGETGLLVDEHDVRGMGARMLCIATNPPLAEKLGRAGRERVARHFAIDRQLNKLTSILEAAVNAQVGTDDQQKKWQALAAV